MFWRKIMSGWRKVFPIHWMKILANLILFSNWIKIKDGSVLVRRMKILVKLRLFSYGIENGWYYRSNCFCKENDNLGEFDTIVDESILVKSKFLKGVPLPNFWTKIRNSWKTPQGAPFQHFWDFPPKC